jgi:hypothetical protein
MIERRELKETVDKKREGDRTCHGATKEKSNGGEKSI